MKYDFTQYLDKDEEIKEIYNFEDYYVTTNGRVFSTKRGYIKERTPFLDSKGHYLLINLCKNNKKENKLVHRLVAEAFIENPNNLPEVNHKDKDKRNAKKDNLEWCSRKENLNDSYSTKSPVRNNTECDLFYNNEYIGHFQSIKKACRYAKKYYNASISSLSKYYQYENICLFKNNSNQDNKKKMIKTKNKKRYKKSNIRLYKNNYFLKDFKTANELSIYLLKNYNINISDTYIRCLYTNNKTYNDFLFKRD